MILNPASSPFHTNDFALAYSLHMAGVPWANEEREGEKRTTVLFHFYSEDMLARLGYRGLPLIEAGKKAFADGAKGHVEYLFERTPRIEALLAAYSAQTKAIDAETGTGAEMVANLAARFIDGQMQADEFMVRLGVVTLRTRKNLANEWKRHRAKLQIKASGNIKDLPAPDGVARKRFPGFMFIDLDASAETLKKFNL